MSQRSDLAHPFSSTILAFFPLLGSGNCDATEVAVTEGRCRSATYASCGDYATYCLELVGGTGPGVNRVSVNGHWTPGANIDLLMKYGGTGDTRVFPGDFVILSRPAGNHIGIFLGNQARVAAYFKFYAVTFSSFAISSIAGQRRDASGRITTRMASALADLAGDIATEPATERISSPPPFFTMDGNGIGGLARITARHEPIIGVIDPRPFIPMFAGSWTGSGPRTGGTGGTPDVIRDHGPADQTSHAACCAVGARRQ